VLHAKPVEKARHHRAAAVQVIRHQQPCRDRLGQDGQTDEMARFLLARHFQHAVHAKLDALRES
jgi:hypothetical protein